MVDRLFFVADLAVLYDLRCAGRRDFDFYLPPVMTAESVLDVGCGTGELLHLARKAGHRGRFVWAGSGGGHVGAGAQQDRCRLDTR